MILRLRYCILSCLLAFAGLNPAQGQDKHFSQVMMTPQLTNPATTGMFRGAYRVYLNHRNQWVGLGSPYKTSGGSFDTKIKLNDQRNSAYLGIGGNVFSDKAGDANLGLFEGNLMVSGVLPVAENQWASAGLQVGFGQHKINMASLNWGNQFNGSSFDPSLPTGEADVVSSSLFFDVSAGVNYRFANFTNNFIGEDVFQLDIGAAYFHLNRPQINFIASAPEQLHSKFLFRATARRDIPGTTVGIVPFAQFSSQGPNNELIVGSLLRFKLKNASKFTDIFTETALSAGIQYRNKDAISPQVYLEFVGWQIGIVYDYNTSTLSQVSNGNGAFEISVRYINFNDPRISSRRGKSKTRL